MTPDQVQEIQRTLGRIEGKLDGFETRFTALETLDARIDSLEGWRKWLLGVQAAIAAMVLFALKLLGK